MAARRRSGLRWSLPCMRHPMWRWVRGLARAPSPRASILVTWGQCKKTYLLWPSPASFNLPHFSPSSLPRMKFTAPTLQTSTGCQDDNLPGNPSMLARLYGNDAACDSCLPLFLAATSLGLDVRSACCTCCDRFSAGGEPEGLRQSALTPIAR